jgi:phenylalanyl-tRNA synthetase beta subunit
MTDSERLFGRMGMEPVPVVEAKESKSQEHSIARNWLLPSLLGFLEKNKNNEVKKDGI